MKTYFLDVLMHHYVDFSGRATRKQFWLFVLWAILIPFIVGIIGGLSGSQSVQTALTPLVLLYELLLIIPYIAIGARRLRDGGFSPWLLLLMLIPGIGGLILLILFLLPSK